MHKNNVLAVTFLFSLSLISALSSLASANGEWWLEGKFGPNGVLGYFTIISPMNKTYKSNVPTLNVNGSVITGVNVILYLNYSLDEQPSTPLTITTEPTFQNKGRFDASASIPQLSDGSHKITVFGCLDANGLNPSQNTVYFTVGSLNTPESSTPSPEPTITPNPSLEETFPTTLAVASILVVAVAGTILLLCFKKRKH